MKALEIITNISNKNNLDIYRDSKSNPEIIYLYDFDYELLKIKLIKKDDLNNTEGIYWKNNFKYKIFDIKEFDEIFYDSELELLISPNYLFIVKYFDIGAEAIKIEINNIQFYINFLISKKRKEKKFTIHDSNYLYWLSEWNNLKNKITFEDENFNNIIKLKVFNNVINNGSKKDFSKTHRFGFKLSSKTYNNILHIIFALEIKEKNSITIGVKIIPEINKTLQNFIFYNSKSPIQNYTYQNDPTNLNKIIKNNLEYYNIIEIDEKAELINLHID
jgi:hypothetical protein